MTRKTIITLVATVLLGCSASAGHASGTNILGGLKFRFWNTASDITVTRHRDRDELYSRHEGQDCWTENQWQDTRHGRRVVKRERKCR